MGAPVREELGDMLIPDIETPEPNQTLNPLHYVSKTLWHFVKGRDDAALDILVKKILNRNATSLHLKKAPDGINFRRLQVAPSSAGGIGVGGILPKKPSGEKEILEPRAVCFADIPFNFLPIHIRTYAGLGLGFTRTELSKEHPQLRPVQYFPLITRATLNAARDQSRKRLTLSPYSKLPSNEESFEKIYREREWRITTDLKLETKLLTCVVFMTRDSLKLAMRRPKIKKLADSGVSLLACDDHFFRESEEK